MKRDKAVALILEARRQGYTEAEQSYMALLKTVNHGHRIAPLEAEVTRLTAENARLCKQQIELFEDADLGRLVEAMPQKWTLLHCVGYWSAHGEVEHGANGDTPAEALRAAGVGQQEEPDAP